MERESPEDLLAAARALAFRPDSSVVERIDAALELAADPGEAGRLHLARAIAVQGQGDASRSAASAEQAIQLLTASGDVALAAFAAAVCAVFLDQTEHLDRAVDFAVDAMVLLQDAELDHLESVRASLALSGFFSRLAAFEPAIEFGGRAFAGAVELAGVPVDSVAYSYGYIAAEGAHVTNDETVRAHRVAAARRAAEWLIEHGTNEVSTTMLGTGLLAEISIATGVPHRPDAHDALADRYDGVAADLVAWHQLIRGTLHLRHGDPIAAIELLDAAVPGLKASADNHCLVRALTERSAAKVAVGDVEGALDDMNELATTTRRWQLDQVGRLAAQVTRRADLERSSSQLRSHAEVLEHGMDHDRVTGVHSRHWLDRELIGLERSGGLGSVTMFDIDHFKSVNDRFGHPLGDEVLTRFGALLLASTNERCSVARYGGEEFVVIVRSDEANDAIDLAERIRLTVATHDWESIVPGLALTTSAGVAFGDLGDAQRLLVDADRALLVAKRRGRNCVRSSGEHSLVEFA